MKLLISVILMILMLNSCGTTEYVDKPVVEYVDNNVTEYVDRNVTVYVDRIVTEYVDRTVVEYIDRVETIYIDRNVTVYIDRIVTEYVDRNVTVYVDRNVTVYVDRNVTEYIEVDNEPTECILKDFDSKFTGRIIYEDGSPYKRGSIKAQGDNWVSVGVTDDNGTFSIGVSGDERFIFSAYSPYGDYEFYSFITPLVVPQYETGKSYMCEYDEDIITCYENNQTAG